MAESSNAEHTGHDVTVQGSPRSSGLRHDFDRVFDEFFNAPWLAPFAGRALDPFHRAERGAGLQLPSVDVTETEKEFRITAELPGVDEKDMDVSLEDGVLTISGEKKSEHKEQKENYYLAERQYGAVRRSFRLPDIIDTEAVAANFEKGVLTVTLPKSEKKATAKKIEVKGH